MKYTSSEAAKLLKGLNEQHDLLISKESQCSTFVAALSEDIESVRPNYDYAATSLQLDEIERRIRTVKHAVNVFNSTHTVPGFDMTIDAMLVYLPQLNAKRSRLQAMSANLPKKRERGSAQSNIIDYRYTNYDVAAVEKDYLAVCELIAKAQTALDFVNNTETMEIDL